MGDIGSDERFAAGDSHLLDAKLNEKPGESNNLFERQDLLTFQKLVTFTKDLRGHAVWATKVATVCYGDAEIPYATAERVSCGLACSSEFHALEPRE